MPPGGPLTVHHTGTPKAAVVPGATTPTIDQPLLCAQHQAKHFLAIITLPLTTTPFER